MTERKYRCAQCGGWFTMPLGASIAAKAEAEEKFGGQYKEEDMVAVCDDCYKKLSTKVGSGRVKKHWWRR